MPSGIKVENRDEEASLTCTAGTFYFGPYYDDAPEPDESDEKACDRYYEWKFVWTDCKGKVQCVVHASDLPGNDTHSYDEPTSLLLCGIGHCLKEGWLTEGVKP
jgi:hypothetical protein